MPFFALAIVGSRLIREANKLLEDDGVEKIEDLDKEDQIEFLKEFEEKNLGYNELVIKQNITLKEICKNDKTFNEDFEKYLEAFDLKTRGLLGVGAAEHIYN